MRLFEAFELAFSVARANKIRFSLSVLGVVIGVAAVIIVVAIGNAGQTQIQRELKTFGKNAVWIWRDPEQRREWKDDFLSSPYEVSMEDLLPLQKSVPGVVGVSGILTTQGKLEIPGLSKNVDIMGVTENFFRLNNEQLKQGRLFTPLDFASTEKGVVLSEGAEQLMRQRSFQDQGKITLRGEKFWVVGTLQKKDRPFINLIRSGRGGGLEEVYVPLPIVQQWLGTKHLSYLQLEASQDRGDAVSRAAVNLLKARHRSLPVFRTETMEQYVKTSNRILGITQIILTLASLISLIVGGIGIMNMMIVSVTERTREIGTRKALGATRKAILLQFLAESILVTVVGGVCGLLFAWGAVFIVTLVSGIRGLLYLPAIVMALVLSFWVGLLAGLYPAWQAANLDPAEALRRE